MIKELLANHTLICGLCAWLISQILKLLINGLRTHQWNLRNFWADGGMPSAHTASVTAVTIAAGFQEGFSSALFAVCVIFSCVVIHDAVGVRREAGKQGKIINEILRWPEAQPESAASGDLKERIGHSPLEVAAGALIGIACAVIFHLIL